MKSYRNTLCNFPNLLLALFFGLSSGSAYAEELSIWIENRGSVPVYIALMDYDGLLGTSSVEGWTKISPTSRLLGAKLLHRGSTYGTYYMAFAIEKNGQLGLINPNMGGRSSVISKTDKKWVVSPRKEFRYRGNYKKLQRAGSGQRLVPFAVEISTFETDRETSVEVSVSPSHSTAIELHLTEEEDHPPNAQNPQSWWGEFETD